MTKNEMHPESIGLGDSTDNTLNGNLSVSIYDVTALSFEETSGIISDLSGDIFSEDPTILPIDSSVSTLIDNVDTVDSVGLYLKQIGEFPLLTKHQEIELSERVQQGLMASEELEAGNLSEDERIELQEIAIDGTLAARDFANANLRLVVSIAKKYQNKGLSILDLI